MNHKVQLAIRGGVKVESIKFVKICDVPKVIKGEWTEDRPNIYNYENGLYAEYCTSHPERGYKIVLVIDGCVSVFDDE